MNADLDLRRAARKHFRANARLCATATHKGKEEIDGPEGIVSELSDLVFAGAAGGPKAEALDVAMRFLEVSLKMLEHHGMLGEERDGGNDDED